MYSVRHYAQGFDDGVMGFSKVHPEFNDNDYADYLLGVYAGLDYMEEWPTYETYDGEWVVTNLDGSRELDPAFDHRIVPE